MTEETMEAQEKALREFRTRLECTREDAAAYARETARLCRAIDQWMERQRVVRTKKFLDYRIFIHEYLIDNHELIEHLIDEDGSWLRPGDGFDLIIDTPGIFFEVYLQPKGTPADGIWRPGIVPIGTTFIRIPLDELWNDYDASGCAD